MCGLATGEALMRAVTEVRIEAARYANPLTSLSGNIPNRHAHQAPRTAPRIIPRMLLRPEPFQALP